MATFTLPLVVPQVAAIPDASPINPHLVTVVATALGSTKTKPVSFAAPKPKDMTDNYNAMVATQKQAAIALAQAEAAQTAAAAQAVQVATPAPAAPQAAPTLPSGSHTDWMAAAGISPGDYGYVDYIVSHESGWNPTEYNAQGSGAYGLGQALPAGKMAPYGADYMTNPITQLIWASAYAVSRYGSWAASYSHWLAYHSW